MKSINTAMLLALFCSACTHIAPPENDGLLRLDTHAQALRAGGFGTENLNAAEARLLAITFPPPRHIYAGQIAEQVDRMIPCFGKGIETDDRTRIRVREHRSFWERSSVPPSDPEEDSGIFFSEGHPEVERFYQLLNTTNDASLLHFLWFLVAGKNCDYVTSNNVITVIRRRDEGQQFPAGDAPGAAPEE